MTKAVIHFTPTTLQRVNEAESSGKYHVRCGTSYIPLKRFLLPLVGSVGFIIFPAVRTYVYLPLLIFFVCFIIFWNFPGIITFMNSKPLYYEDLFLTGFNSVPIKINSTVRLKFECAFEWSLIFTNALFTAALSEYWLYQAGNANSYVEIVGVTGGILKIFQSVNHMNGGIILYITRKLIDRELNNASNISQKRIAIELKETNHEGESSEGASMQGKRDSVERDSVERDSVEGNSVERDSVEGNSVERALGEDPIIILLTDPNDLEAVPSSQAALQSCQD